MANNNPNPTRGIGGKFTGSKPSSGNEARADNGRDFVDPVAAGQAAGEPNEPGQRPKRPNVGSGAPGGTGATAKPAKEKSASLDLTTCVALLQSSHDLISRLRGEPHWRLSDPDARQYGQALANATRHVKIAVAQKYVDYYTLGLTVLMMETPRLVISTQLARQPKQPPRGPAQVYYPFAANPNPQPPSPPPAAATPSSSPASEGGGMPPIADPPPLEFDAFGGDAVAP
jgi:hypothetical protein